MNEMQKSEIRKYVKHTKFKRAVFIALLIFPAIIIPLGFYIFMVNETLSFKNLDTESYDSRMNDSLSFAIILFGFLILLVSPFVLIISNMFKRYLEFIKTLSAKDIEKLFSLNEKENFIYKYMPSYILKENTVTFFTMFRQTTIDFNDIISIDVQQTFRNEYKYTALIIIKTKLIKYPYTLSGNSFKVRYLLSEALAVNPQIINNEN